MTTSTTTDFAAALRPGPGTVDLTNDFTGRTAVVTGGASGIGNAIARALAARGARVAIVDVRADGATTAAADLPAADLPAAGLHAGFGCDVTDETSVARTVADVVAQFGRIDVLVNCAGIAALAPADELSAETWSRTIDVNLTGTFRVAQAVGRHMLAAGYGRVVNIASQAAHVGIDGHAAYCASKAGVIGLTRVLALEWGGRGVTVNTVSPTVVLTDLGRAAWANENGIRHQDEIPTGRFATPDEIAAAVLFLAGESSAMVNGADLRVDGGFTIR
ncbi:NAD(P)-dependent dehydrogenase (short-subunit alcohol dehydrogenase family) [Curtobacterium sp. PhB142]|uniref:GolD/DthD family dehydrogenase n=1 Tax=unclassified Curtobacterium TaxID=257496 RepID=UPI001044A6B4|nr:MULTISPECIES: D-threitol dehydrogenase [unclassified Curtobacterium]TCL87063.1 NAD(P)-dependent dehydrogenase (short-subunit alcohol dehydrogenase family) [Curtobacterium sp. PhB142]TCM03034.1 NAD(P)-dependent dehydrogenase (short-subunit alcohol dehydrogenase family) [Curtobacterium sp. PhB134]